jgi:hypothetical protein
VRCKGISRVATAWLVARRIVACVFFLYRQQDRSPPSLLGGDLGRARPPTRGPLLVSHVAREFRPCYSVSSSISMTETESVIGVRR